MASTYKEIPVFLTPRQLAQLIGEHEVSIRRGIAEGRIPADKVNGRWVIARDAVFPNSSAIIKSASYEAGDYSENVIGDDPYATRRGSQTADEADEGKGAAGLGVLSDRTTRTAKKAYEPDKTKASCCSRIGSGNIITISHSS